MVVERKFVLLIVCGVVCVCVCGDVWLFPAVEKSFQLQWPLCKQDTSKYDFLFILFLHPVKRNDVQLPQITFKPTIN